MGVHASSMGNISISDWISVILHGLPMDCSMAGYMTVLPALFTVANIWTDSSKLKFIVKVYIAITATIISIVAILDLALYGYWNFRLDTTPFFYFFSSPTSALASTSIWIALSGLLCAIIFAVLIYLFITQLVQIFNIKASHNIGVTISALILTALLIIPIRGSVTVSTMNLSRSYFSPNQRLNHAAINPLFSVMYSATHQNNFSEQFRYFEGKYADRIIADLYSFKEEQRDSIIPLFKTERPDIYIIILESFSVHLLPSLGGEKIATGLDSIAHQGILFSNFYASGARTDRALPAILSAFPAQPTTSLMKYAKKIEHVSSLPRALSDVGYDLSYYYGGDANFTNMLAYLVSSGFKHIVSDKDFPSSELTGKWGAHDHFVFNRAWNDIVMDSFPNEQPKLRVIQTSSSHEPFEVPYSNPRFSDSIKKNAFAYADKSVTAFIDSLSSSPQWIKSIVVITADHYGAYPENIENPLARHHVPLIITGGALNMAPSIIETIGDQTDIAATILKAMNINSSDFTFSKDLFDNKLIHHAFFSEPGIAAYVSDNDTIVINLDAEKTIFESGKNPTIATERCKALLQKIYTTISEL